MFTVHSAIRFDLMGSCLSRCAGRYRARSYRYEPLGLSVSTTGPDATHCVRSNSVPSLQDILHHLDEVRSDWFSIGLVLWVKMAKLREIEQRYLMTDGTRRCLAEMIQHWLYSDPSACWERLVRALEQLDLLTLAAAIKQKHLWEASESVVSSSQSIQWFSCTDVIVMFTYSCADYCCISYTSHSQ